MTLPRIALLSLLATFATTEMHAARTFVYAKLLEKIRPIERGERYEEPLDAELKRVRLGECDGGGTMQAKDGEIEYIGLDIQLDDLERGIPFVVRFLETRGVAAGSALEYEISGTKKTVVFGVVEGVGVYLDGTSLPDEVYRTSDVNVVIAELEKRIAPKGKMRAYWQGPKETALYFYGDSAADMVAAMKPFLASYPLCKNARIVSLTPKREVSEKKPNEASEPTSGLAPGRGSL